MGTHSATATPGEEGSSSSIPNLGETAAAGSLRKLPAAEETALEAEEETEEEAAENTLDRTACKRSGSPE